LIAIIENGNHVNAYTYTHAYT